MSSALFRFSLVCALFAAGVAPVDAGADTVGSAMEATRPELPRAAQDGGPRRWRLTTADGPIALLRSPGGEGAIAGTVPDQSILANHGCLAHEDAVWCDVEPFAGGPRGYVPHRYLSPATGPGGTVVYGEDLSPKRAKQGDFDARRDIPCAQVEAVPLGTCSARVARGGGGDATVVATFSNGFARTLYFRNGDFLRANATMSGVGTDTEWTLKKGLYLIRVDDQRFELPEDFLFGT